MSKQRRIYDEKRIHSIKFTCGDTLYRDMQDLAYFNGRTLADLIHTAMLRYMYGESLELQKQKDLVGQQGPE